MINSKYSQILFVRWWYYFTRVIICVMVVTITTGCKGLIPQPGDWQKGYSLFSGVCKSLPEGIQTPERSEASLSAITKLLGYERKLSLRPDRMSMNDLGVKDRETLLMIEQDFCVHPGNPAIADYGWFYATVDGYFGLLAAFVTDKIGKYTIAPILGALPDTTSAAGKSADPPIPSVERMESLHLVSSLISVTASPIPRKVNVYYGTNRQRSSKSSEKHPSLAFTDQTGPLAYGICSVSIPDRHAIGSIERPFVPSHLPWHAPEFEEWAEDPKKHMTMFSVTEMSAQEFSDRLQQSRQKEAFVYIHGIGNTFQDACLRAGQMAYDLKFKGAPIIFSWPAHLNIRQYQADQTSIDRSRGPLKTFIELVSNAAHIDTLHLIAHSLGNRGLIYAIDELRIPASIKRFRELVLIAPDFDTATFWDLAKGISKSADRVTIYASSNDMALNLAKSLSEGHRLGLAEPDLFLMDGFDSVDATDVDTSFLTLHHTPHGKPTVVTDLRELLLGKPAASRTYLRGKIGHRSPIPYFYFIPGAYE